MTYGQRGKEEVPPAESINSIKRWQRKDEVDDAETKRRRVRVAQRKVGREEDLGGVVRDNLSLISTVQEKPHCPSPSLAPPTPARPLHRPTHAHGKENSHSPR